MARVWADVKRWTIDLLVAYACFAGLGILFTGIGAAWSAHPAWTGNPAYVVSIVLGLVAAGMIRGYLDGPYARVAEWYDDLELWLFDHPVVFVAMFATIGLTSLLRFPWRLVMVAFWGAEGAWNLRRWRKRVARVSAS